MKPGKYVRTKETKEKQSIAMTGRIAWNKGLKSKYFGELHPMFGRKHTEESLKKISKSQKNRLSKIYTLDNSSPHRWIEMLLGKPNYCEHCKRSDKKLYDWSNKDHKYNKDIKDWQRLCRSCHMKYDIKNNNRQFWGNKKINN